VQQHPAQDLDRKHHRNLTQPQVLAEHLLAQHQGGRQTLPQLDPTPTVRPHLDRQTLIRPHPGVLDLPVPLDHLQISPPLLAEFGQRRSPGQSHDFEQLQSRAYLQGQDHFTDRQPPPVLPDRLVGGRVPTGDRTDERFTTVVQDQGGPEALVGDSTGQHGGTAPGLEAGVLVLHELPARVPQQAAGLGGQREDETEQVRARCVCGGGLGQECGGAGERHRNQKPAGVQQHRERQE